jgi:hypothetical protein
MMPFPSEDTTPPVTKMYFVSTLMVMFGFFYPIWVQKYENSCESPNTGRGAERLVASKFNASARISE